MKLVYINIGRSSVFESQVMSLLSYYRKHDLIGEISLLFGYQNEEDRNWLISKNKSQFRLIFFRTYPNYVIYRRKTERNMLNAIKELSDSFEEYFFHVRTELTSYHFKNVCDALGVRTDQVLTDIRGASIPEVKEYYNTKWYLKPFKLMNYKKALGSLKTEERISAVSGSLKRYISNQVHINESAIKVVPCLINENFFFSDEKRNEIRKEIDLKDEDLLVVFSSGGVAKWQNNQMIVELASMGFKVLNLSKVTVEHPNIINRFVSYEEVPGYLSAADVSFIWRDKSVVNKVASPVKVSEYIACGLPVIHNGTIDMIGENLNGESESLEIQAINDLNLDTVKKLVRESDRKQLSLKGVQRFGLNNIAYRYITIYKGD